MHIVVNVPGSHAVVLSPVSGRTTAESSTGVEPKGPSPIAPELKELAWGAGSFLVFLVLMRVVLFPRIKAGMEMRYSNVRQDIEGAETVKASARGDVVEYEKAIAAARAEAMTRLDAVRQTIDSERNAQLTQVNARIATARADAEQKISTARAAAQGEVANAVASVASRAVQLISGRIPDAGVVQSAVKIVMESAGRK